MKNKNLIIRLDERESIMLDEVCKYLECSKSDFVRNEIKTFHYAIKYGYVTKKEP